MRRYIFDEGHCNSRRFVVRDAWMRTVTAWLVCLVMVSLPGCGGPSSGLPVISGGSALPSTDPAYPTEIQVKYLGAGGVVIRRGADVVVTAPFFSNPSILRVAFGEIRSLPDQVDRFMKQNDPGLTGATAILVGHAHYDHLMDVSYIKNHYLPQAKIYGSDTMKYTLAGDPSLSGGDVISVEKGMGTDLQPGDWSYAGPRLRFMALKSEHAPIIFHLKFFEGNYDQPLPQIPTRASGWREGQTMAYLIDFLSADGKSVEFRIHYQDAASNPPLGFPPMFNLPQDQRRVDLTLLCVPGFNEVDDYPEGIVKRLKPRFVVMIHWENFFELLPDDPKDLRTVPTEKADRFIARLNAVLPADAKSTLPAPGTWMRFTP